MPLNLLTEVNATLDKSAQGDFTITIGGETRRIINASLSLAGDEFTITGGLTAQPSTSFGGQGGFGTPGFSPGDGSGFPSSIPNFGAGS